MAYGFEMLPQIHNRLSKIKQNLQNTKKIGFVRIALMFCSIIWMGIHPSYGREVSQMKKIPENAIVQQAHGAGRWFPGSERELETMVEGFIENATPPPVNGRILGAIAPHAGYVYSGKVAGFTFRAIEDNVKKGFEPETVVVLGFSHRGGFPGVALMDGDAIETPMGKCLLDRKAAKILAASSSRIFFDYTPHRGEHSAENEIPFVQAAVPKARLVVALMGDHNPETVGDLVKGLEALSGEKKILVVASTDLLHDASYEMVTQTDQQTLEKIRHMNIEGLQREWGYDKQICCGIGPVTAVMKFAAAKGCTKGSVLYYRNSGDDFPESRGRWVVGYGAAVFAVE